MCDCYDQQCEQEGCEETIPVHIGDYRFPRDQVKAWCHKHIPTGVQGCVPTRAGVEISVLVMDEDGYKKGQMFALSLAGGTLRPSDEDVEPNLSTWPIRWFKHAAKEPQT